MNKKNMPTGMPGIEDPSGNTADEEVIIGPDLEAAAALLSSAKEAVQVPAGFASKLESELLKRASVSRNQKDAGYRLFGRPVSRLGVMLAGAATLAIILLLALPLLTPALSHLVNPPAVTPEIQAGLANPVTPQPIPTRAASTSPSIPTQAPSVQAPGAQLLLAFFGSSAQAQSNTGSIFGKARLTLSVNFPASPKAVTVYEQRADPALTPALAKEQAAKLGIQGEVYQSSSEGGGTIYYVTDGLQEVWFMQGATHFTYVADMNNSMIGRPSNLPLEKRVQAAEAFLKKAGLLDFDYRVNEALSQGRKVVFDRLFNDMPLLEDNFNPDIVVEVNDDGKVDIAMVGLNHMASLGNYPIRSAEDAWGIVLGDPNDKRVQYTITDPATNMPEIVASWNRSYPDGPRVDITFYPSVLLSAEPGGQPWVTLGPFTLRGDLSSLLAAYNGPQDLSPEQKQMVASGEVSEKRAIGWSRFFHVWGQANTQANGSRSLQVEGWERSPMPDDIFFGTLEQKNGTRLFAAEDGKKWTLADLPADIPLGERISVRGVRIKDQPGVFDWSFIQVEPPAPAQANGGGGGGGGGGLSQFSPTPGQAATEIAPLPMPYQSGDRLEGVTAILDMAEKMIYPDGKTEMVYLAGLPSPKDPLNVTSVKLIGDNLQGLESLIELHVKIWGTFQMVGDLPTIQVERYEKAYPDEIYQAWIGRQAVVTLDGRKALLFTDISGKQYVFERSLENSPVDLEDGYRGEQFVVEGTLSHETFAGYPMIVESMSFIAPGRTGLNGYQVQGNKVMEDHEGGTQNQPPLLQDSVKEVVIDRVELVYFAYDLSHGGGYDLNTSPMRYVQPVWRFSGKLDDGRLVQVLVQAVTDEYLAER